MIKGCYLLQEALCIWILDQLSVRTRLLKRHHTGACEIIITCSLIYINIAAGKHKKKNKTKRSKRASVNYVFLFNTKEGTGSYSPSEERHSTKAQPVRGAWIY